jgi:hypothetical protein
LVSDAVGHEFAHARVDGVVGTFRAFEQDSDAVRGDTVPRDRLCGGKRRCVHVGRVVFGNSTEQPASLRRVE